MHRIGESVLLLHDVSDIFLHAAKMCSYLENDMQVPMFYTFTVVWIITRLILFPYKIIHSVTIQILNNCPNPPIWAHLFYILLIILQVLHIFWSYFIAKVVYRKVVLDKVSFYSFVLEVPNKFQFQFQREDVREN